jgi:hypothetical protein
MKVKRNGGNGKHFIAEGRKSISMLEVSQAAPTHPDGAVWKWRGIMVTSSGLRQGPQNFYFNVVKLISVLFINLVLISQKTNNGILMGRPRNRIRLPTILTAWPDVNNTQPFGVNIISQHRKVSILFLNYVHTYPSRTNKITSWRACDYNT